MYTLMSDLTQINQEPAGPISRLAPAKVNLLLDIVGKRPDGYHEMDMINHAVSFGDRLTLVPDRKYRLIIDGSDLGTGEDNLVTKAVRLMEKTAGRTADFRMELEKRIPSQAGLGGGSSDAAAAIVLIDEYWDLKLPTDEMIRLGAEIGADVPYLIDPVPARVSGIGEVMEPIPDFSPPGEYLILIKPPTGVPTPQAFADADQEADRVHPDLPAFLEALEREDAGEMRRVGGNSFFDGVSRRVPEVREAYEALEAQGAFYTVMSGSGSTVVGYFRSPEEQSRAYDALAKDFEDCILVKTEFFNGKGNAPDTGSELVQAAPGDRV